MKTHIFVIHFFLLISFLRASSDISVFENDFLVHTTQAHERKLRANLSQENQSTYRIKICGKPSAKDIYEAIKMQMDSHLPICLLSVVNSQKEPSDFYTKRYLSLLKDLKIFIIFVSTVDFEIPGYRFDFRKILEKCSQE